MKRITLISLAAAASVAPLAVAQSPASRLVDSAFAQLRARNLDSVAVLLGPVIDSAVRATPLERAVAWMLRGVFDFYRSGDSATAQDFRASLGLTLAVRGEWMVPLDSSLGALWQRERGRAICGSAPRDSELGAGGAATIPRDSTAVSTPFQLVEKPRILRGPPPRYPEDLMRARRGGRVLLAVIIDTAGRVESGSIKVIDSADEEFTREARRYLEKAVFQPGRIGGRPVRVCVQVPVDFKVTGP